MLHAIVILGGWLLMMGQHSRSESLLLFPHRRSGSWKPLIAGDRPPREFWFCTWQAWCCVRPTAKPVDPRLTPKCCCGSCCWNLTAIVRL